MIGLTWAGSPAHPWRSASTIAPIVIGVCTLAACFLYDFTIAKNPFFPLPVFKLVIFEVISVFVAGMIFYSMAGLLPQATMYCFTNDPMEIGWVQLPNGFGQLFFGGLVCLIMGKLGHLKLQVIAMLVLQTVFVALYAAVIPSNKAAWMAFQFFGNGPFTLLTLVCYVLVGLNVPLRHIGVASGLIGTFRSAGGAFGNAIFNTILNGVSGDQIPERVSEVLFWNDLDASLLPRLIPAALQNAVGAPGAFDGLNLSADVQAQVALAVRDSYAYAFRMVFYATIPFGVVAIVGACFIQDASQYLTNHTAVHMQRESVVFGRADLEGRVVREGKVPKGARVEEVEKVLGKEAAESGSGSERSDGITKKE
ncbi:hypothetical protein LTS18_014494 [Coniosporium uncinatum]|uniref:Uncharacterized protein n=1 Tax=Coniosporium uncinatum TaxID=93489 RepID=A0ACC3CV23_9PEZI|nr:hypothetical protein LTS18_014494 [Coniosporium uncinatum]